jgi:cytochrome c-type biogenesis protein CcmH/NrfG
MQLSEPLRIGAMNSGQSRSALKRGDRGLKATRPGCGSWLTPIGGNLVMANETLSPPAAQVYLQAPKVYAMAAISLVVGLAVGYMLQTVTANRTAPIPVARAAATSPHNGAMTPAGHMPSLAEMQQIANKQAAPLLAKLKTDPNDPALLIQIGSMYHEAHQFKDASTYFERAVKADPRNLTAHTKLAISLYRAGDADAAIAELNRGLSYDAKDANSLFNLGMIKMEGKHDTKGALAAWQKLLKLNPQLDPQRKSEVEELMAHVTATPAAAKPIEGAKTND